MLTRRTFLKTTLGASTLAATAGSAGVAALQSTLLNNNSVPVLVFADGGYEQTLAFSTVFSTISSSTSNTDPLSTPSPTKQTLSHIDKDVAAQIREVDDFCGTNADGVLIGLTRDSDFFILEHTAAQHGFKLQYKGVHDFRGEFMRHQVSAPETLAPVLADTLNKAQHSWPQQLARIAPTIVQAQGELVDVELQTTLNYQNDEPGYLVSWLLKTV
ncbi:MAG: hypothetical protein KBT63_09475 [Porticoccaceae bacterium]|nr:hypothetical protein [Porticoccaceae bacterium]